MTVERVQQMYIGAHDLAVEHNQPSAAVSAITGIARLYGMDKDASLDKQEPDVLTDKELESFRQLSIKMTKPTKTA
jgi:DNA helicase IV